MMTNKQRAKIAAHKNNFFLRNWPYGTIAIVNGVGVTTKDIVAQHREDQRRRLVEIRRDMSDKIKRCIVWTFYNDSWCYGGWHLYVVVHKDSFHLGLRRSPDLCERVMKLFPCGIFSIGQDDIFDAWKEAFAKTFPASTAKRSRDQGMKFAWAKINQRGDLIDVALTKKEL